MNNIKKHFKRSTTLPVSDPTAPVPDVPAPVISAESGA